MNIHHIEILELTPRNPSFIQISNTIGREVGHFNAQVIGAVAKCLREIELRAKPDDRRYVAGILASEYLREYNVVK